MLAASFYVGIGHDDLNLNLTLEEQFAHSRGARREAYKLRADGLSNTGYGC